MFHEGVRNHRWGRKSINERLLILLSLNFLVFKDELTALYQRVVERVKYKMTYIYKELKIAIDTS